MLAPAIGMVAGVAAALLAPGLAWIIAAAGIAMFVALQFTRTGALAFVFLSAGIGALATLAHASPAPPEWLCGINGRFYGKVLQCQERADGSYRCILLIDKADSIAAKEGIHEMKGPFKCLIVTRDVLRMPDIGARVRFNGEIVPIEDENTGVPFASDYNRYMILQGVEAQARSYDRSFAVTAQPRGFQRAVNHARDAIFNAIATSPVDGPAAGFLLAAILGDNAFLDYGSREAFRTTGVAHILALSGLHVGILVSMLGFFLFPLRLARGGIYLRGAITLALVWLYAIVTGLSPSVTRAAVMVSVYMAARMLQRPAVPFNSLCMAVVVTLMINPRSLFTPGFQMSFCSVAAILAVMSLLPLSLKKHRLAYHVTAFALLPVAAMIGSGMITMLYFGEFPILFLVANMVAGLIFPGLLGSGIVLALLTLAGISAPWLGSIVDLLYMCLSSSIDWLATLPLTHFQSVHLSAWAIAPYALCVASALLAISLRNYDTAAGRPSWLAWSVAAVCASATALIALWPDTDAPDAEAILTCDGQDLLILRDGRDACVLSLASDSGDGQVSLERYREYFLRRRCGDVAVNPDYFRGEHISYADRSARLPGATLRIVNSDTLIAAKSRSTVYAVVAHGFTGSISDIVRCFDPDTIVLGASVRPARKSRLLRECADSVPVIDLRKRPVSITY